MVIHSEDRLFPFHSASRYITENSLRTILSDGGFISVEPTHLELAHFMWSGLLLASLSCTNLTFFFLFHVSSEAMKNQSSCSLHLTNSLKIEAKLCALVCMNSLTP